MYHSWQQSLYKLSVKVWLGAPENRIDINVVMKRYVGVSINKSSEIVVEGVILSVELITQTKTLLRDNILTKFKV